MRPLVCPVAHLWLKRGHSLAADVKAKAPLRHKEPEQRLAAHPQLPDPDTVVYHRCREQTAMSNSHSARAPQTRLADTIIRSVEFLQVLTRGSWPLIDLAIRLWLAQAFLVSGVLKAGNWETALLLAREEYPVPWMDPVTAAYTGVSIELIAPVLLALGLATRFASLSLLLLTLVIQQYYLALDVQLFWAWLFGWYLIRGAGPLSLDRMLARGLANSAVPFAASVLGLAGWISGHAGPLYGLGLRLWLAVGLILATTDGAAPSNP